MRNEINICLSTDDNYIQHTATVVASILYNANTAHTYHFYILSTQLSEANKTKFNALKKIRSCKIDYPVLDEKLLSPFKKVKMHPHLTLATFNRLLIPLLFPNIDKMIYIDSDLVVLSDISDLNDIDIENYYFAGVKDANSKALVKKHGYSEKYEYINAGVIIINCKALRKNDYFNKMLMQIGKIEAKTGDQDFINYCFHKKIKLISYKWNMYHKFHFESYGGKQPLEDRDYADAVQNPKIVHFVGPDKPWNPGSCHPYKEEYIKYLAMTPWSYTICKMQEYDFLSDTNLYPMGVGIVSLGCNEEIQNYLTAKGVYNITQKNYMPFDNCYASLQGVVRTLKQNFNNLILNLKYNNERGYFVNEDLNFFFNKDRDCKDDYQRFKQRIDSRINNFKFAINSNKPLFFILKASSDVDLINNLYVHIKKLRKEKPFRLIVVDSFNRLSGLKSEIIHCSIRSPYKDDTQWCNPKFNMTSEAETYRQNIVSFIIKEIKYFHKISKQFGFIRAVSNTEKRYFFSLFGLRLFSLRKQIHAKQQKKKNVFRIVGIPILQWKENIKSKIYWLLNIRICKIKQTINRYIFYFLGLNVFKIKKGQNKNIYYLLGIRIGKKNDKQFNLFCFSVKKKGIYRILTFLGVPIFYRTFAYTSTAQLPSNIKAIKRLKNKYKGKRCFIIGGSPSLNMLDLTKLNNEYTCTVGKGYKLVDKGLKHSTFHVFGDIFGYAETSTELDVNFSDMYFFRSAIDCVNDIKNKVFFDTYERETNPAFLGCQLDITKPLYCGKTVVIYALQIMAYLGFKEIIFVGVDLRFKQVDGHAYVSSHQETKREQWSILNQAFMYNSIYYCSKYISKYKNITIVNASPVEGMNFLEKRQFNSLF